MKQRNALFNISRLIDESNGKEVSVETSFSEDLRLCIEKLNISKSKPSQYYKPSSLSCIRNMYYQRVGANTDNTSTSAEMIGVCESGTDRHLRIQSYISAMKDVGIDCEYVSVPEFVRDNNLSDLEVLESHQYETKLFNKKYNLRFLVDGIIKYKGEYYILEIKTESEHKWVSRNGVAPDHYNQAFTYSLSLGLDKVLFIYENRDVCSKKYFLLTVSDDDRKSVADKINTCESYVNSSIVPSKPQDLAKKICQYCIYKTMCRKDK